MHDTYLYDLGGERLARLAPESSTNLADLHQRHAFSSDSTQLAFARRQTLQLLDAQDGARRSRITLPEPARFLTFSADASTLAVVTVADRLLRVRVADGSVTDTRIHRVSDGEVLNLRAIARTGLLHGVMRGGRRTRLLAFSDSGWFDMNSGQPLHLRVRAGASFDAEMASPHENPHRREGLVAAFFSGERLAPAE